MQQQNQQESIDKRLIEESKLELFQYLGCGTYGRSYLVRRKEKDKKTYVLKIGLLKIFNETDWNLMARVIVKEETNPHIAKPFARKDADPYHLLLMDYCNEGSLKVLLARNTSLPLEAAKTIAFSILKALFSVHRNRMCYHCIKPENVFFHLSEAEPGEIEVKLGDLFFSAVPSKESGFLTKNKCNSHPFCSPEALSGGKVGGKSDLYSVGIILFMMLSGRHPFNCDSEEDRIHQMETLSTTPPLHSPCFSSASSHLLSRLLDPSPSSRISSSQALSHPFFISPLRPSTGLSLISTPPQRLTQHELLWLRLGEGDDFFHSLRLRNSSVLSARKEGVKQKFGRVVDIAAVEEGIQRENAIQMMKSDTERMEREKQLAAEEYLKEEEEREKAERTEKEKERDAEAKTHSERAESETNAEEWKRLSETDFHLHSQEHIQPQLQPQPLSENESDSDAPSLHKSEEPTFIHSHNSLKCADSQKVQQFASKEDIPQSKHLPLDKSLRSSLPSLSLHSLSQRQDFPHTSRSSSTSTSSTTSSAPILSYSFSSQSSLLTPRFSTFSSSISSSLSSSSSSSFSSSSSSSTDAASRDYINSHTKLKAQSGHLHSTSSSFSHSKQHPSASSFMSLSSSLHLPSVLPFHPIPSTESSIALLQLECDVWKAISQRIAHPLHTKEMRNWLKRAVDECHSLLLPMMLPVKDSEVEDKSALAVLRADVAFCLAHTNQLPSAVSLPSALNQKSVAKGKANEEKHREHSGAQHTELLKSIDVLLRCSPPLDVAGELCLLADELFRRCDLEAAAVPLPLLRSLLNLLTLPFSQVTLEFVVPLFSLLASELHARTLADEGLAELLVQLLLHNTRSIRLRALDLLTALVSHRVFSQICRDGSHPLRKMLESSGNLSVLVLISRFSKDKAISAQLERIFTILSSSGKQKR